MEIISPIQEMFLCPVPRVLLWLVLWTGYPESIFYSQLTKIRWTWMRDLNKRDISFGWSICCFTMRCSFSISGYGGRCRTFRWPQSSNLQWEIPPSIANPSNVYINPNGIGLMTILEARRWFQPILKIFSSNWIISPSTAENKNLFLVLYWHREKKTQRFCGNLNLLLYMQKRFVLMPWVRNMWYNDNANQQKIWTLVYNLIDVIDSPCCSNAGKHGYVGTWADWNLK